MEKEPSYAIIIPTLNRPAYLEKCLVALHRQSKPPRSIIIVDQSDNDDTEKLFNGINLDPVEKIYVRQTVKSLTIARNNGLDRAGNVDFISFMDDDSEANPDFYQKLIEHLKKDTREEYAGGMGLVSSGFKPSPVYFRFLLIPHQGDGKFLVNGLPTYPYRQKNFCETEFVSGGGNLYRNKIIRQFRYDENLIGYGYGDDVDISYRLSRKYKNFFDPKALYHHDDESTGRDPGIKFRKFEIQNYFYLLKKNVGLNAKSFLGYVWFVFGRITDDLIHMRKGALLGNFIAISNLLRNKIDSVHMPTD